MEAFGEFLASRPVLGRRLALNGFVLMAGLLLMLARTSPALASDNGHGQGKAQDHTSASAVAQRHDSQSAHNEQTVGGDGDGKKGKGKGEGGTGSGSHTNGSSGHTSGSDKTGGTSNAAVKPSVSSGDSSGEGLRQLEQRRARERRLQRQGKSRHACEL